MEITSPVHRKPRENRQGKHGIDPDGLGRSAKNSAGTGMTSPGLISYRTAIFVIVTTIF